MRSTFGHYHPQQQHHQIIAPEPKRNGRLADYVAKEVISGSVVNSGKTGLAAPDRLGKAKEERK
ncbi:hypothetical protein BLOT_013552 [Blomia tropicalis]|nr:hypothetical protein BLOT_013552 [Blomia tropicalis]